MKLRIATLAVAALLAAGPAFASHCPQDMAKIDAALAKNPQLSSADMAEVKKLRAEGESLHKAGKHPQSEAALGKAMKLLKI